MYIIFPILISIIFYNVHYILFNKKITKFKSHFIELIILILFSTIFSYTCFKNIKYIYSISFNILNCISLYIIYYYFYNLKCKNSIPKFFFIFLLFALSFYLEIYVFNFHHFETLSNKKENIDLKLSTNIKKTSDKEYIVLNNKDAYIEIKNINKHVKSLKVDICYTNNLPLEIIPSVTDESSNIYFNLSSRNISSIIPQSKYLVFDLVGNTNKIKINLPYLSSGDIFNINEIIINPVVPILFSYIRFMLVWIFLIIIYLIRPSSLFYKYKALDNFKYKKYILATIFTVSILAIFTLVNINPKLKNITYEDYFTAYDQYYKLSESLLHKKFYLEESPNNNLKKLSNPYDKTERQIKIGNNYKWDYAYYKGKYYVYFGIVPCLFLFLPFYIITGTHIPIYVSIFIGGVLCTFSIFYLIKKLIKQYFPNTPFLIYLELSFLMVISSNLLYIFKRPDFYSVPIIYGLFFTFLGLGLWISSLNNNSINKLKLILGSICIGLTLGCRPQLFLSCILGLVIFLPYLKSKKCNKEKIRNVFICFIPIIIIGICLMYYNYKRFNSPFDFGANYNLTTNDMTHKSKSFKRVFLGLFTYLFQPTTINSVFPFINCQSVNSQYLGKLITEPFAGGLIYNNLILFLSLFIFKFKKIFKNKNAFNLALISTILGIIIIIFDTIMSGILPRYIADFSWLFIISTIIIVMQLYDILKKKHQMMFLKVILIFIGAAFIYQFLFLFTDISLLLVDNNPISFYKMSYFLQFWL